MTSAVAHLIRTPVNPLNAHRMEEECHSELCRAHAYGDRSDYEAMRGKIALCKGARWEVGISFCDLLELMDEDYGDYE